MNLEDYFKRLQRLAEQQKHANDKDKDSSKRDGGLGYRLH